MIDKEDIIRLYDMKPLDVEGGMWKAMFRSDEMLPEGIPEGREGAHALYGSILYLLTRKSISRMHRLVTDEIWHFYIGAECEQVTLYPDGTGKIEKLGNDIVNGDKVTTMVPRGVWQGTRITGDGEWALLGTTMAPGYEDADYEDGTDELIDQYPDMAELIRPLLVRPEGELK